MIQARDGFDLPDVAELTDHCSAHVARYKVPRLVVSVPSIMRSPSGKADYRWARATLADQVG